MSSGHKLLQNAVLLDTESLGLQRGSGLHELAVYSLQSGAMNEFILTPNLVQLAAATAQEYTQLATSSADVTELIERGRWNDIIKIMLIMDKHVDPSASDTEVLKAFEAAHPWVAKSREKFPHLQGRAPTAQEQQQRSELLRQAGVQSFDSKTVSPAELLKPGGELQSLLRGKTVWGANIAFDSKQIGALASSTGLEGTLKEGLQTAGTTADPLYVTGVKVNQARVAAQQTGDWTNVWRAYLADVPSAGETAVRDVQDVLRAMINYGQKLGLAEQGDLYWGTGLDLTYRLMGSTEGGEAGQAKLLAAESHRAAEDLALHTKYVLEKSLSWTSALQAVDEGTPEAKALLEQASKQQGPLWEAATYFKRRDLLGKDVRRINLIKRLGRAQQDLLDGRTYQVDGWERVQQLTQRTPSGQKVQVPFLSPNRVAVDDMDSVVNLLSAQQRYGPREDVLTEATGVINAISGGKDVVDKKRLLAQYLEQKTSGVLEEQIAQRSENIMTAHNNQLGASVTKAKRLGAMVGQASEVLSFAKAPALLKHWGAFAAAGAGAGLIWSMADGNSNPAGDTPSLVTYDYHQWLQHQGEFYGNRTVDEQNQGMSERGIAGNMRRRFTDFGSPYRGIFGSQQVFHDQELLQEREKWLREQYGAVHYDPVSGLFGIGSIISRARHQGYDFLAGATPVANGYQGLRGGHLMKVNAGDGNWKMNVEDADTIVLKRGGITGAIGSLFGMNKGYSFRLAGVDAPEIEHAGNYGGAQPHSRASIAGLKDYLSRSKNLELVFDPEQTTYGRTMGVLLAGGKNVNYELVRRGLAGHLPYGKRSDSMIDYQVMGAMEQASAGQSRGMWSHPYWKTLYTITDESGSRPTFNTLTKKSRIVENISMMDTVSMMEMAEDSGMYSSAMAIEASRIGKFTRRGVDQVRPVVTGNAASHFNSYMHEMKSDTDRWMKTKGNSRIAQNTYSARNGYGKLDQALVLDSMAHTDSVWSKRRLAAYSQYNTQAATRRHRQAEMQRNANQNIFQSQIGHSVY